MSKNLKIVLLVLVIILVGEFIFYNYFSQPKSVTPVVPMTDAQRLELMRQPSNIPPINPKITDAQRLNSLNQASKIPPLKN